MSARYDWRPSIHAACPEPSAIAAAASARARRDAENREAREEQREPAEKHGFVAETGHEHSGRHVEQQYADAAQAHDQSCECRAVPKLEHVQRQQNVRASWLTAIKSDGGYTGTSRRSYGAGKRIASHYNDVRSVEIC